MCRLTKKPETFTPEHLPLPLPPAHAPRTLPRSRVRVRKVLGELTPVAANRELARQRGGMRPPLPPLPVLGGGDMMCPVYETLPRAARVGLQEPLPLYQVCDRAW